MGKYEVDLLDGFDGREIVFNDILSWMEVHITT